MATITVEVPDGLNSDIEAELPQLLSLAISLYQNNRAESGDHSQSAYSEILDFLLSTPTAEEILAFRASPTLQSRLEKLLDKNRDTNLDMIEQAELDSYRQINHMVIMLKARARRQLQL